MKKEIILFKFMKWMAVLLNVKEAKIKTITS